jgi:hypothetical protein
MTYLMGSDDKRGDLIYHDDYRAYLITRSADEYRFAKSHGKRVRVQLRSALRRVNVFFTKLIEAIADSKVRRMQRELWLRGVRYDRLNDDPAPPNSGPAEHSR